MSEITLLKFFHRYSFFIKITSCMIMLTNLIMIRLNTKLIPLNILLGINISFLLLFLVLLLFGAYFFARGIFKLRKYSNEIPFPDYLTKLAERMKVKFRSYCTSTGLKNAINIGNIKLIIDEKIINEFSQEEIKAIFAHEFSHARLSFKHKFLLVIGFFIATIISLNLYPHLNFYFNYITIISYFYLLLFYFFWYSELDSDRLAINYINPEDLVNAMIKLFPNEIDSYSFTHPSIRYRINKIKKMYKNNIIKQFK